MPRYVKRTGRDVDDDILLRLKEAEARLAKLEGSARRTSMDRGDTAAVPAPIEGQTMVQYDTEAAKYYSNGAWRSFGSSLSVSDGTTTVTPTTSLDIDPEGLVVTGTTPTATLALDDYQAFTPTLTADTSNPVLGSGGAAGGVFVQFKHFVHMTGTFTFGGTGRSAGTGTWRIGLPMAINSTAEIVGRVYLQSNGSPRKLWEFTAFREGTPDISHFALMYSDATPTGPGNLTLFDSSSGWTLANGDILGFYLVIYSNT